MIEIKRDKQNLKIVIDTKRSWTIPFSFDCTTELYAILMKEHIEKLFGNRIEEIRRDAYEKGWKDKSGHKAKRTWFNRCINNDL